jgi:HPt (histidine-containing phosphotransfer) domain-containing protein
MLSFAHNCSISSRENYLELVVALRLLMLVEIFFGDYPRTIVEIRDAIADSDFERVGRAAHSIKGALGYFSDSRSQAAALRLETMGINRDLTNARTALAELETSLAVLKLSLSVFVREPVI